MRAGAGGSGAYEPRLISAERTLLSASGDWWGRAAGLGPGIARIEFLSVPAVGRRFALLRDGVVEIAYDLDDGAAAELTDREPLLTATGTDGDAVGASAAVRGLRAGPTAQPLSEVWLTLLR